MKSAAQSRIVAVIEALKGLVVVVAGFGLLSVARRGVQQVVEELMPHLHLNPAREHPNIFLQAMQHLGNAHLQWLALAAMAYALLRFVEAFGLWRGRAWAEWLAVISGGIYLPFEIYELTRGITALRLATFLANLLVVAVMIMALYARRRTSREGS